MFRKPSPTEWDTSRLPADRLAYLDRELSFEQIAAQIGDELHVVRARTERYRDRPPGVPKDVRQVIFLFRVRNQTCDLLYNAPDGLRGRYWQSPDHGFSATRHLIGTLLSALLSFAKQSPPAPRENVTPMTLAEIRASLDAPSAKIWPRERDDNHDILLVENELVVPRWVRNEEHAEINRGMWRRTPKGSELEIKGALLGTDGTEYIPDGKRDRSCQIHRFGYT